MSECQIDFPVEPYNAVHAHCRENPTVIGDNEKRQEYGTAWNAVAYRFRQVHDHDLAFRKAVADNVDQYVEERELFGFFMAGLSTIETFSYGVYFLASAVRPSDFPTAKKQSVDFKNTVQLFGDHFPNEPITSTMSKLRSDQDFKAWKEARNILAHRCAPSRTQHRNVAHGSNPASADPNDVWHLDNCELNEATTRDRRTWLARELSKLMKDAESFVKANV